MGHYFLDTQYDSKKEGFYNYPKYSLREVQKIVNEKRKENPDICKKEGKRPKGSQKMGPSHHLSRFLPTTQPLLSIRCKL